jgi:WD40 repeat protein
MLERNAVHIFTPPTHPAQSSARVDGGELGIERASWSPNSQDLIIFGKDGIRADIWNLRTSRLTALPLIKDCKKGFAFNPNKHVLGYLTRRNGKDSLALRSVEDWRFINQIDLETLDARQFIWAPDGVLIAIADCQIEHRVSILDTESGSITTFEGYQGQKGVISMAWCINGHLLAIGSGNDVIHILFTPDWAVLAELNHIKLTRCDNAEHYEEETPGKFAESKFPLKDFDASASGIDRIEWSPTGKYIASTSFCYPKSLFIWEVETFTLGYVFTFMTTVADFKWSPTNDNLAVAAGTDKLLNWRPSGFRVSHSQEAAIQIQLLVWRADGEALAAFDTIAGTCTMSFVLRDGE